MRNLSITEMINVNGGSVDAKKERSFFDSAVNTVGSAITGLAGIVSSWF